MRHSALPAAHAVKFLPKPLAMGIALALSGGAFMSLPAIAETKALPKVVVVGTELGDAERQPGSVGIVTEEELELRQPRSTEEALRSVPGVAIKPEEESAIVANIGIRGLSSADYKTLILEDGVPIAPGLFVGNGRYYNPRIQRMETIEVLKGAASLRYGPSTIGGVINYITKQPEDGVQLEARAGSFNSREATLEVGGSSPSQEAQFGAFITHASSDGFMDKGYDMTDVMIKTGMAIGDNQWLGVKISDYDSEANISYRGVFLQQYKDGVDENPAPDDYFISGRRGVDINHEWDINATTKLTTLVFGSETYRDYWRYNTDNTASAAAGQWVYLDTLNGNNRSFERFGVDSRLKLQHQLFGIANEAEFGVRLMNESMDDVTVAAIRATPRTGTINKDQVESADSLALYAQNRFVVTERLAVTAGLRVESYEQTTKNKRAATNNEADTSNTEVLPGLGATYQINSALQGFASVYEAFSPALNGDALNGLEDQKLDAERSVNVEAGLRGARDKVNYELTFFRMDFDNQIIPANSNSQFQRTNGGETLHQGLEAALGWDLGAGFSLNSSATYIPDAEFVGARRDANGNITTPDGNRVTYVPEWVTNLSLEYKTGKLRTAISLHHTGEQYTDVQNTKPITESTSGFFTGQIDSYTLVDLNAIYEFSKDLSISASAKNLTDENYIASLRQGIYVGTERTIDVGVKFKF
ncbi:TonB-dependent receptor domain-containing protein [Cellvibrio sp. KY-YJ-3]|uniref:TonB-dependent receptor family protein n=1 Tax=Cellvibrio sp. KY-YJ-3 TaxID=454662 RepID=UPI00124907FC|nr:TonB-dependent receptor [Cellvibrio sp. KY-YJ-3]QEY13717.1 TonB-dependent receptor [Cellvibrio sp. KY-YJ-3]